LPPEAKIACVLEIDPRKVLDVDNRAGSGGNEAPAKVIGIN
jgi:hypothetical protein